MVYDAVFSSWICHGKSFFASYALAQQMCHRAAIGGIAACINAVSIGEETELFWSFVAGHVKVEQLGLLMEALGTAYRGQRQRDMGGWLLFACRCLSEAI